MCADRGWVMFKKLGCRAGGMSQIIEHLPSKHEALSAIPSTTKINKKKLEYKMYTSGLGV
jgi:hypothetical protein